jgi:hypothetical protein
MADERRLNIRIDPEIHRRLRMDAAQQDKSIQQVVEELLRAKYGPSPPPDEGRKGGVTYPRGGSPAMICHDGSPSSSA